MVWFYRSNVLGGINRGLLVLLGRLVIGLSGDRFARRTSSCKGDALLC